MDVWDRKQTQTLISLLKLCPILYNSNHPKFLNQEERLEKYKFILSGLKDIKQNLTIMGLKKKIRTLYSQMSKERSSAQKFKTQRPNEVYKPRLWCYNELSFLNNKNDEIVVETPIVTYQQTFKEEPPIDEEFIIEEEEEEEEDEESTCHNEDVIDNDNDNDDDDDDDDMFMEDQTFENSIFPDETMSEENVVAAKISQKEKTKIIKKSNNFTSKLQKEALDVLNALKSMATLEEENNIVTPQKSFCNFLEIELQRIKLMETFDELKVEILQLVQRKVHQENRILAEQRHKP